MITADLHIHSCYSTSHDKIVDFKQLSINAELKGLNVISTGDCLHPKWIKEIRKLNEIDKGTFQLGNTNFILSAEIETVDKVHHLLFFPDLTSIYNFKEKIQYYSDNIDTEGRPTIKLTSQEIMPYLIDVNALIGPSHIFDQISGIYSYYDSLYDCYGPYYSNIYFAELGLGLDTYLADRIKELHNVTFLSNSDSHNPHPIRLGREFTILKVKEPTFTEIKNSLMRKNGNKPLLNVGIPPEEGKYYFSACSKCFKHYTYEQAKKNKWKCKCGFRIKKGINDKIIDKSDFINPQHPYHRPLYLTILPLHEIITKTLNEQNPFTQNVTYYWEKLIETFGDEIHVMLETPIKDIAKTTLPSIAEAVQSFRMATIKFKPGGGGKYGKLTVPWEENYLLFSLKNNINQKIIQI